MYGIQDASRQPADLVFEIASDFVALCYLNPNAVRPASAAERALFDEYFPPLTEEEKAAAEGCTVVYDIVQHNSVDALSSAAWKIQFVLRVDDGDEVVTAYHNGDSSYSNRLVDLQGAIAAIESGDDTFDPVHALFSTDDLKFMR